ncbi:MAG: lytic transglycosylase domain-containing protein [Lentisphaerae bacterium]|nr:lytic transglycosylase domain-containing protein [Lentisphaerota bacterium]
MSNRARHWVTILALAAGLTLMLAGAYRHWRLHAHNASIARAARTYDVPPALIRAVIWRESKFDHRSVGKSGEIGLMQVTPVAAGEWAKDEGIQNFTKYELFKPEINIMAGTWYLGRALRSWSQKSNPLPYALAEYNAGRSNALRWAAQDRDDPNIFWNNITYPSTKRYIHDVINQYRRYED